MSIRNLLARLFGCRPKGGRTGPPQGYEVAGVVHPGVKIFRYPGDPMSPELLDPELKYRGMQLCPNCIYRFDKDGNIVEVIDCRTLNHRGLNEHGWNGPLTGNGDTN